MIFAKCIGSDPGQRWKFCGRDDLGPLTFIRRGITTGRSRTTPGCALAGHLAQRFWQRAFVFSIQLSSRICESARPFCSTMSTPCAPSSSTALIYCEVPNCSGEAYSIAMPLRPSATVTYERVGMCGWRPRGHGSWRRRGLVILRPRK
eukprot:scaffold255603_cov33-Tisochrysis_lutea.AAC.1